MAGFVIVTEYVITFYHMTMQAAPKSKLGLLGIWEPRDETFVHHVLFGFVFAFHGTSLPIVRCF